MTDEREIGGSIGEQERLWNEGVKLIRESNFDCPPEAVKQAAEHLRNNPYCLNFGNSRIPASKNEVTCPCAWIGYFRGCRPGESLSSATGDPWMKFTQALTCLSGNTDWRNNAEEAAKVLHSAAYVLRMVNAERENGAEDAPNEDAPSIWDDGPDTI